MFQWLKKFFIGGIDDRLYADAVRAEGVRAGLMGKELEAHVEESLELRKIINETCLRSSEEE